MTPEELRELETKVDLIIKCEEDKEKWFWRLEKVCSKRVGA